MSAELFQVPCDTTCGGEIRMASIVLVMAGISLAWKSRNSTGDVMSKAS
ncbi:MAG: hypothetical protein R3D67_12500 [Hyphomicrobiaceae bacterium]